MDGMALEPLTGRLQALLAPVLAGRDVSTYLLHAPQMGFVRPRNSVLITFSCPSPRALEALYQREMLLFQFLRGFVGLANPCTAIQQQTG